ncbi:MAG: PTS sugar transporter subunit IIC, partial [Mycoplasma sp.]|nr:PTS sugar transporter subunit IIC [Mycoplasma sp.]
MNSVINFFKEFLATPSILIGVFVLLGMILQAKKVSEIITSTIKTIIGFLIIGAGAGILAGAIDKLGKSFNLLFNIQGIIANNDVIPGILFNTLPKLLTSAVSILIGSMFLNILLAKITSHKYIYLTGHVLFYFSTMIASVLHISGLDLEKDFFLIVFCGSLITSLYMVLAPSLLNRYVIDITKSNDIALAHTGNLSYFFSANFGRFINFIFKNKVKKTEDIKFSQNLIFLRNTNVAIGLTMFLIYLIIYLTTFSIYGYKEMVNNQIISEGENIFVQSILQAFTFAAGVEVLIIGVKMFVSEVIPSFKGISTKLIPKAKSGLDCPIMFTYAPNAVLIGFIFSFIGGIIGMFILIALDQSINWQIIIIPSIIPHFFVGATCGVFANHKGGVIGVILATFINGILMTFVPYLYIGLDLMENSKNIAWGDSDFIIGLPIALLGKWLGRSIIYWLFPLLFSILWLIFPIYTLIKNYCFKNKKINNDFELKKIIKQNIKNKIVTVCGQGLGSSLIIELNLKNVVKKLN